MPPQGQIGHKQRPLRTFPQGKRESPSSPRAGRSSLASSHAGTRLPIAVCSCRNRPRALPLCLPSPGKSELSRWWPPFLKKIVDRSGGECQKKGPPPPDEPEQIFLLHRALRRHDPDQVTQVEAVASSQPAKRTPCLPVFSVIPRRLVVKGEFSLGFGGEEPQGATAGCRIVGRRGGILLVCCPWR